MADKGFEWIQLWSAWRTQTPEIQRGWMMGLGGLKTHLEDFMKNYPRDVQDEVFGHAPSDVCKVFGYVRSPDPSEIVRPSRYNPNRQPAILKNPSLSQMTKNKLLSILEA
jgi:hypothetical protein